MDNDLPQALDSFSKRVSALHLYDDEIDARVAKLPRMPLAYIPSNRGLVALNLALHNVGMLRVANEAVEAFKLLWQHSLFTNVALPARFLFELWGAACYAEQLTKQIDAKEQFDAAFERSVELYLGSRYPVPQFHGKVSEIPSIRASKLVDAITRYKSDAKDTYGFLCEACHPNNLQLTYFWMAGPKGNNWSNLKFAEYGTRLVERLVASVEECLLGLISVSRTVQQRCGLHIDSDRAGPEVHAGPSPIS